MTTRTFTSKNNDLWFWEETPETIDALKKLHKAVEDSNKNKLELKRPNEYKTTDS